MNNTNKEFEKMVYMLEEISKCKTIEEAKDYGELIGTIKEKYNMQMTKNREGVN